MKTRKGSWKYNRCDCLCRLIALMRAQNRCELCPNPENKPIMRHHIFFGRWASCWQLRLVHEFHIILCFDCHYEFPYAPHLHKENNKLFIVKMADVLRERDPGRLAVIDAARGQLNQLDNSRPPLDVIHEALKEEFDRMGQTCWMDLESQHIQTGRII